MFFIHAKLEWKSFRGLLLRMSFVTLGKDIFIKTVILLILQFDKSIYQACCKEMFPVKDVKGNLKIPIAG
jgi:hypothetical protein